MFPKLLFKLWASGFSIEAIVNSFKATEIVPFNKQIFTAQDYSKTKIVPTVQSPISPNSFLAKLRKTFEHQKDE